MRKFIENDQWKIINDRFLANSANIDLSTFKRTPAYTKFTCWDYRIEGARYMKMFIFSEASRFDEKMWRFLSNIENRDVGNPVQIHMNGQGVCVDYMVSAYELATLEPTLENIESIVEIGAGFGRTCHSILCNFKNITKYFIIDLPPSLNLSARYLERVLPKEEFNKISFVENARTEDVGDAFDLAINIDSMAEMHDYVVDAYLSWIGRQCRRFYVKNPLGKFLPSDLELTDCDPVLVEKAMQSGKLRQIISAFDADEMKRHVPAYLDAYRPGSDWVCLQHGWARPWSYYHQALFERPEGR